MDAKQVAAVVSQARAASPWWASRTFAQRARYLHAWAAWLTAHTDELLELLEDEQGKPQDEALLELVPTLEHVRWAANNANRVLRRRPVS
jgi:aldehyde dehydrogenase (NAD+)